MKPGLTALLVLLASARAFGASTQALPDMPNVEGGNPLVVNGTREEILADAGVPVLESSHQVSPRRGQTGIGGYRSLGADDWIGMQGLDSCVGMVIQWKEGDHTQAIVAHFNVQHDPKATLEQYEAKHGLFVPAGATAYLAGGEDSRPSLSLLKGVIAALKARKARIASYQPYTSLWVNDKGLLGYSFDGRGIYAGGYTSAAGREAMEARQKELRERNAAATAAAQAARRAREAGAPASPD